MNCKNKKCLNNMSRKGFKNKCKKSFQVKLDKNGKCKNAVYIKCDKAPYNLEAISEIGVGTPENNEKFEIISYLEKIANNIIDHKLIKNCILKKNKYKEFIKDEKVINYFNNKPFIMNDWIESNLYNFYVNKILPDYFKNFKLKGFIDYLIELNPKKYICFLIWVKNE